MKKFVSRYLIPNKNNGFQPHLLRKKALTLFVILFFAIEITVLAQLLFVFRMTDFLAAVLPGALVSLTNEERSDASLDTLTTSSILETAAKLKAEDMAEKGYFAHTSPEGLEPWHWLNVVGYDYIFAGENLAVNFTESADVSDAWMNSESHRRNIISEKYTEIGIATAEGTYKGKKTTFVVQFFGRPAYATAPTQNPILVEQPAQKPAPVKATEPSSPTKSPTPKPVVVAENTPESIVVDVVLSPEVNGEQSIVKHTITKITTSPRMYANYIIGILVALLLGVLFIAILVKIHVQHPKMIAASVAVAMFGIGLISFNNAVLNSKIELPAEDSAASSFMAF